MAVAARSLPAPANKEFVAAGIVDYADLANSASCNRNRHGKMRIAVRKIGGSIDRIDDPNPLGIIDRNTGAGAFLAQERMTWPGRADPARDQRFRRLVDFGY